MGGVSMNDIEESDPKSTDDKYYAYDTHVDLDSITKYFDWEKNIKNCAKFGGGTLLCFWIFEFHWIPFIPLLGLFYFISRLIGPATSRQIEQKYQEYGDNLVRKAIEECNCEEDEMIQKPDWFWYPSDYGIQGSTIKYREDIYWRCNTRNFVVLLYGPDSIMTFENHFCVETDDISTDENSEYFFEDVAGIEVSDERLELRTSGGSKIFPLASQGSASMETTGKDRADQVCSCVRAILREKKRTK
jgi:hypothetical protein